MATMIEKNTSIDHNILAREYVTSMTKGKHNPNRQLDIFGKYEEYIKDVERYGNKCRWNIGLVVDKINGIPLLKELIHEPQDHEEKLYILSGETPPLPDAIQSPLEGSRGACLWHDE